MCYFIITRADQKRKDGFYYDENKTVKKLLFTGQLDMKKPMV